MVDQERKEIERLKQLDRLNWELQKLAFEYQDIPVWEVHEMIRIAWNFAPKPKRRSGGDDFEELKAS